MKMNVRKTEFDWFWYRKWHSLTLSCSTLDYSEFSNYSLGNKKLELMKAHNHWAAPVLDNSLYFFSFFLFFYFEKTRLSKKKKPVLSMETLIYTQEHFGFILSCCYNKPYWSASKQSEQLYCLAVLSCGESPSHCSKARKKKCIRIGKGRNETVHSWDRLHRKRQQVYRKAPTTSRLSSAGLQDARSIYEIQLYFCVSTMNNWNSNF